MNSSKTVVIVVASTAPVYQAAADLAAELALPLVADPVAIDCTHWLNLTPQRLELRERNLVGTARSIYVDFTQGPAAHRRRFGGGCNQPLARAIGLKGGTPLIVLDATAGLGRDAFVLACLGCTVYLLERSPIIAALLRDGLQRAAQDPEIGSLVAERLHLIAANGHDYLQNLPEEQRPDTIYLDPMYPHRQKSALVKKEMRLLRQLVGDDEDAPELLAAALTRARRRVVVKRPRLAPPLAGPPPGFRIVSPNTRFDVYPISHQSSAK
ncbi:MAG TPA: class I SAM-dependent methyltransferase [Candidatus Competibacter sp.]|nr:class I SAM-dependent methyltransferase [Candidatus Competibacter sp.]